MAYFNKVTIIGNLTRDSEVKQSHSGIPLCSFAIASNRLFKNKQTGEIGKDVCFIDVNFWGQDAESRNQSLKKGCEVLIEGRIKFNSWQDHAGNKRSKHLIIADRVIPMHRNYADTLESSSMQIPGATVGLVSNAHSNASKPSINNIPVSDGSVGQRQDQSEDLPF